MSKYQSILIEDRSEAAKRLTLEDFRPHWSKNCLDDKGDVAFSPEEVVLANRIGMPTTPAPSRKG